MFLLTGFIFLDTAVQPSGTSDNYSDSSGITIDDANRTITLPEAESQTFDIWGVTGMLVLLVAAIALGIVASIQAVGSGLDNLGQSLIFNGMIFMGMWTCLTIISAELLFDNIILTLVWMMLTLMFVIGFATHIQGSSA